MTYNTPPIIMFFFLILYYTYRQVMGIEDEEEEQKELVEGLADYYDALKLEDKRIIRGQEEHYVNKFRMKTFSDEQYGKLKNADQADEEHIIMGCATYRLLDSELYVQAFQYEPPKYIEKTGVTERDRVIFITTDDDEDKLLADKDYDEA